MEGAVSELPEWLKNDFLKKVLSLFKNDDTIEVSNFKIGSGFSEHYGSSMFQCKIDFKSVKNDEPLEESIDVVIKARPSGEGYSQNLLSDAPFFKTEIEMYSKVIPAINQLFKANGLETELGPELIYAAEEPFPVIVLRDLSTDGFFAPRQPPDDIEDSKRIIQRLAQFHAASFYLAETKKLDFGNFTYSVFDSDVVVNDMYKDSFQAFKEVVATWEGFEDFVPKIECFADNVKKLGKESYVANKPSYGFNVLNHGDFHMRNILVKLNPEKSVDKFNFIDFQLCCYCSPVVDVNYMLNVVKMDEKISKEELIMFYHREFVNALKNFGYSKSPPTLLDLNLELLKHGKIGVFMGICCTSFAYIDAETMDINDLFEAHSEKSINFRKKLFEHPMCKSILQKDLKTWLHKGFFD